MVTSSGARSPARAMKTGAYAGGARALDIGAERVADVQRPRRLDDAGQRERVEEDRGIRLGRADLGRGDRAVEQRRQARLDQALVQREVPVGDDDEPRLRARAARANAGAASGNARNSKRRQQRFHERRRAGCRSAQLGADRLGAARAQVGEPRRRAALVQVRAVVADLGRDRARRERLVDLEPGVLAQRGAQARRRGLAARAASRAHRAGPRNRWNTVGRHGGRARYPSRRDDRGLDLGRRLAPGGDRRSRRWSTALLARRGMKLAQAVARGELRPEIDTRLRFLRRLLVRRRSSSSGSRSRCCSSAASTSSPPACSPPARSPRRSSASPRARRSPTSSPGSCSRSRSRCGSATG